MIHMYIHNVLNTANPGGGLFNGPGGVNHYIAVADCKLPYLSIY